MDMEEAIMQMELIGHSFFVYRDAESDSIIKVVILIQNKKPFRAFYYYSSVSIKP